MFQFISDLDFLFFFFLNHLYLYIVLLKPVFLLILLTCSFPLSFFLLHSFSAFKYHHLFNSVTYYSLLVQIPPAIFLFFLFVLFFRHFSCSQLWTVIWFSLDIIWDFLPVSRSLSFVFPLFFFFSCWLSSTYDLIWIFVAFLTATGVVSLKSDFAIQYQNCNFSRRYLNYSTCTLLCCIFFPLFYLYLFIHIFIFCFALIFFSLAVLYSRVS